jgi:beta-glucosidase
VVAANKNTIVVVTSGGATDMTAWLDKVPALLQSWYPGQEGGTALAQLLFGEVSPSGKLPITFDRRFEDSAAFTSYYPLPEGRNQVKYAETIFGGYRHYDREGTKPNFPFGYGLSYTKFAYSHISLDPPSGKLDQPVSVSFDVTNVGGREASEVAEVYVGQVQASVPRPVKELKGFAKLVLKAGETRHVSITLDRRAFSFYDVATKDWSAPSGQYAIFVGPSSADTPLKANFTLR